MSTHTKHGQQQKLRTLKIESITKTTEAQKKSLTPYSNSRLVAVNQCPTWGVVSSQKRYASSARAMALEAGELMHQVFAAVRIWQLEHIQDLPGHAAVTGTRIFGKQRWHKILKGVRAKGDFEQLCELAFAVMDTSDWVDNPVDKVRTRQNMELAAMEYIKERLPYMENWPIYVKDEKDSKALVGIEQVFDVVVLFSDGRQIRYIGTLDGCIIKAATGQYCVDENKTASRLDEGWRSSFELSNQITGYCACSGIILGFPVMKVRVTGTKIKPSGRGEDCYALEPLVRDDEFIQSWGRWLHFTVSLYERYKDNYEDAPRFTHSCNRYFRPCALIPFCGDTVAGRREQWGNMVEPDRSPSERAVMEVG